jgi:predicted glycosyltransferase
MTVVAGPLCPDDTIQHLRHAAAGDDRVRIVATVPNLAREMRESSMSVSQCGYNTALDILQARVPALVVPFAENGDSEQTDRARRLARLNALRMLPPSELTPDALARAIHDTLNFVPDPVRLDLDGGARSARLLADMCRVGRRSAASSQRECHESLA